jgi:hypothetical protein
VSPVELPNGGSVVVHGPDLEALAGRIDVVADATISGSATVEVGRAAHGGPLERVLHHTATTPVTSGVIRIRGAVDDLAHDAGAPSTAAATGGAGSAGPAHAVIRVTGGPGGATLGDVRWYVVSPATRATVWRALGGLRAEAVEHYCAHRELTDPVEPLEETVSVTAVPGGLRHLLGCVGGALTALGTLTPPRLAARQLVVPAGSVPVAAAATARAVVHRLPGGRWGIVARRDRWATVRLALTLAARLARNAVRAAIRRLR